MDEDTIIKNRLAVDERPLRNLIKRYLVWAKSLDRVSVEDAQTNFEFVMIQLAQYELAMARHQLIHDMNEREVRQYEEACARIDQEVDEAQRDIKQLKIKLGEAEQVRENKRVYDVKANEINAHQTRDKSHAIINQLNTHIRTLEREKAAYHATFELRKKQFYSLVTGVHDLQDSIKEEREKGNEIAAMMLSMEDTLDGDVASLGAATPLPMQAASPALVRADTNMTVDGVAESQEEEEGEDEEGMVVETDGRGNRGGDDGGDMMDIS